MSAEHGRADAFVVANEFAMVSLRKVHTRNGERLEIRSLSQDRSVLLDAIALEALTWSSPLEVGRGLETPFGPEPTGADGAADVNDPNDVEEDQ